MLVLSRKVNERVRVGKDVVITVTKMRDGKVYLGFEASRDIPILRDELEPYGGAATGTPEGGTEAPPPFGATIVDSPIPAAGESGFEN